LNETFEFINDNGEKALLEIIDLYEYNEKQYALVIPEESEEAFIYEVQGNDDDLELVEIEDDKLYEEIRLLIEEDLEEI
jgi:hypothetical protein